MNNLLELNKIDVKTSTHYRLRNIQISIHEGEKIALLGKSGAGKSTLISIANGSLKPTKGKVKWNGKNLNSLNRNDRIEIGTLWQDLRLINELNVGQNVNSGALGRHNLFWAICNLIGIPEIQSCISCLKAAGLPKELITSQLSKISEGQKQRVAIARLLRQQAKIILADEPLSSLDPQLSEEIISLLLNKKIIHFCNIPKTYLISIHQPEFIRYFSRVIGLDKGEILFDLPTNKVSNAELKCLYKKNEIY